MCQHPSAGNSSHLSEANGAHGRQCGAMPRQLIVPRLGSPSLPSPTDAYCNDTAWLMQHKPTGLEVDLGRPQIRAKPGRVLPCSPIFDSVRTRLTGMEARDGSVRRGPLQALDNHAGSLLLAYIYCYSTTLPSRTDRRNTSQPGHPPPAYHTKNQSASRLHG